MLTKSRILVLVERLGQGGAEKMALMIAEMLQTTGKYDVYICAIYSIEASLFPSTSLSVNSLEIDLTHGVLARCRNYFMKIISFRKLKKE